jgi:hypothetical protein
MKRKYSNFIVEIEGEEPYETHCWTDAFSNYQSSGNCTIYGLPNYEGANYEVIMSK